MAPAGYFVDAELLVPLVAGSLDRDIIARHRRLSSYSTEDYGTLLGLLDRVEQVYVTPNTLTEASNLLRFHGEPECSQLLGQLAFLTRHSEEIVVASREASARGEYVRLGLTDAALLEVATLDTPVLTADVALYLAALDKSPDSAVNFTHHRNL